MRRVGPARNGVIRPLDMSRFIVMLRRGIGGNTRCDQYACDQDGSRKRQHGLDSLSVCARSRQVGPKDQPPARGRQLGPKRPAQLRRRFAIRLIPLNSALEQQAYLPAGRARAEGQGEVKFWRWLRDAVAPKGAAGAVCSSHRVSYFSFDLNLFRSR
jgi:hypothetical protein